MHPIIKAIEERRTINHFDYTRGISDEALHELVRLATKAPSSFNLQNWRLIAARTPEAKARLRRVGWDQPKITEAAVTFVVVGQPADHQLVPDRLRPAVDADIMPESVATGWAGAAKMLYHEQPQRQRDEAIRSATFAVSTLTFAAEAMGLSTGLMIGFDPEGVSEEFELAADEFPVMLVAVGHATGENWRQKPRRDHTHMLEVA
ncbi:nitroreductase [Actinoplanes italicus]|uniref:Nitroreductase n=1 Tax=Actinoplanes italicus TaxID=113567 RepID=A0A2T0JZ61_9ACTN|nr:nitroreductase family protein [Actinoplanes italicus]PRX15790.1 nitroreductase [Actinoplanes italicus]GIE28588.1 nitroreductase [Actinoplanes italicus]